MKILYWSQQFPPYIGGVEVLGSHFLPALAARGHEPIVVTSHGALDLPDEDEWQGVPVHRLPFAAALEAHDPGAVARTIAAVGALKRRLGPDLVHVNVSDASAFFHLRTARHHPCPSVVSVRVGVGRDGEATTDSLLHGLLESADRVTGVSAATLAEAVAVCPEIEDRARVIHNGLPDPGIAPTPLSVDPPVLVAAGRLVRDKGFDVAVRALARIRARGCAAVLRIAGDGPERGALEALAAEEGVADAVAFLGWIDPPDLPRVLGEASVVLMPSRWREAFGLVALQAAQMGRPVVATRVGGLPEVVAEGETGLLVDRDDVDGLTAASLALLADAAQARELGDAARVRAEDRFGFERYVDEHESLYRELVG